MNEQRYYLIFVILLAVQILLNNFLNMSQLFVLAFLPAMIMCLPMRHGTLYALVLAFVAGFLVDFFGDGVLGMTSMAILPVACLRNSIFNLCFDSETISRTDEISIKKMGLGRLIICVGLALILYLAIYVWVDSAGTRTLTFNMIRFAISFAVNLLFSAATLSLFSSQTDR